MVHVVVVLVGVGVVAVVVEAIHGLCFLSEVRCYSVDLFDFFLNDFEMFELSFGVFVEPNHQVMFNL